MPIIGADRALQSSLTRKYWKRAKSALKEATRPAVALVDEVPLEYLKQAIKRRLTTDIMKEYVELLWVDVGPTFAENVTFEISEARKQEGPDWEAMFTAYINQRSLGLATQIMDTQIETINHFIDLVNAQGLNEGWSVDRITQEIKTALTKDYVKIQDFQAERIARTEVIGASNRGSFEGATSAVMEGIEVKKQWLISGLPNTRRQHELNELEGFVSMDHVYPGNVKYPGDPDGDADQIINCRCTIIYEVD